MSHLNDPNSDLTGRVAAEVQKIDVDTAAIRKMASESREATEGEGEIDLSGFIAKGKNSHGWEGLFSSEGS